MRLVITLCVSVHGFAPDHPVRIDPAHQADVTMFHVAPRSYGPKPLNMDTADSVGDLFFELFEALTVPLACADPESRMHFECENPEAAGTNNVVNKVILTLDDRYSGYAMCNIGRNGTDGMGHACRDGTYCCFCPKDGGHHRHHSFTPCNATVGYADLYERHGGGSRGPCLKDYECWAERAGGILTASTPGAWYSALKYGDCDSHPGSTTNCTWQMKRVVKIVSKQCHTNSFFSHVRAARPENFTSCKPTPNASDPCWVRGFYTAVLGPDSGKPLGKAGGGIPIEQVLKYWNTPLDTDDPELGGCPALPPADPPQPGVTTPLPLSARSEWWRRASIKAQRWWW